MTDRLAQCLVRWLYGRGIIEGNDLSAYVYGACALIYTVMSTTGLLIAGALFHRVEETLLILGIFYVNQTIGGGYHANSHIKCFTVMAVGLMICLALCRICFCAWALYGLLALSYAILLSVPIVLHPNKQYLMERSTLLKRRSRLVSTFQIVVLIILCIFLETWVIACSLGITASAISRLVGLYNTKRHQKS